MKPAQFAPVVEYSPTLYQVSALIMREAERGARPYDFRLNAFTGAIERDGTPIKDTDIIDTTIRLELDFSWRKSPPQVARVWDAVRHVAGRREYHPVRDWLQSLPAWDGVERCPHLLQAYAGIRLDERDEQTARLRREQSVRFILSAVARVMRPGCKVDTVLVLYGAQGCGKSTWIRTLAGDDWFCDTPLDIRSKDCYIQLRGVWFYELAEMRSIQATSPAAVKAFITSTVDSYRPPYGKVVVKTPRECVFVGSTNGYYNHDSTGGRRWWVVEVDRPDIEATARDRAQIFAEALYRLERCGEAWHIDDASMVSALKQEVAGYTIDDPWADQLEEFAGGLGHFTAADFLLHIGLKESVQTHKHVLRVAKICRSLGYQQKRSRANGKRARYWLKP